MGRVKKGQKGTKEMDRERKVLDSTGRVEKQEDGGGR